jgi:hypothetical protein
MSGIKPALISYSGLSGINLINIISRLNKLFIYPSCWDTLLFKTRPAAVRWIRKRVRDKFEIDGLTFS